MIKKIKDIFNKTNYDYSEGYVDPFEYHKTFYCLLKTFRVAEVDKNKSSFLNQNLVIFITGLTAVILSLISLCHGLIISDIPHITEAGAYVIIMMYALIIISCTKINIPQYQSLLTSMQEDFKYICSTGQKYRKRYFEVQLVTWKASLFSFVFTFSISIGMVAFALASLIYYLLTHKPEDRGNRPLLFPFWLPDVDFGKSPIYEIAFIYSDFCAMAYAYNYIFMIQTQIVWIRHITSKADIVIWSIQDLLEGIHPTSDETQRKHFDKLLKSRMKAIMEHHQSMYRLMDTYSDVYKKCLMFEQKACGPVICLSAYCTAEKLDEGEINLILVLLFVATTVLYFIPSHLCTFLRLKVSSVCDACWGIQFWNGGVVLRPYLVLIMQRSLRPLSLEVPGFEEVSIATFSNKMASAYSFFNMLRQANRL